MSADYTEETEDAYDREARLSVEQKEMKHKVIKAWPVIDILPAEEIPEPSGLIRKGVYKYPFDDMKVGESVIVSGKPSKISMAVFRYYQRKGVSGLLTVRSLGGDRWRIWKVAEVADNG